jgi:hypothetical protein
MCIFKIVTTSKDAAAEDDIMYVPFMCVFTIVTSKKDDDSAAATPMAVEDAAGIPRNLVLLLLHELSIFG